MKTFCRILIMMLVLSLMLPLVPGVSAAEITEEATYVLNRDSNGDYLYQYQSCYTMGHDYNKQYGGIGKLTQIFVYTMYNTQSKAHLSAYCVDVGVTAELGHDYRRLNLEDSTYFGNAAGKIRAIVLEGFYIPAGTADHDASVASKLKALGDASGVEDLTASEAIAATQAAIWQAAHGPILEYTDFFRGVNTNISQTKYAALCQQDTKNGHVTLSYGKQTEESDQRIGSRIETVYNYLLSLSPVGPSRKTVSPAAFTDLNDPIFTVNEDGTYTVQVTATVNVAMSAGDSLTLEASLEGHCASTSLQNGSQTVTLTLSDVPAELFRRDVTLSISGYQTASDVFLFDARGGREAAQTMVGMDNSRLPVYAQAVANEDRELKVHKTTNSGRALEGIVFDIHFVTEMEKYNSGEVELPEPGAYNYPSLATYSIITDQNGEASFNFTKHGLPDGVYLVVEQPHPAIVSPIEPFYLFVPMTNAQGTGLEYEITIWPKNEVKGHIGIDKDVTSLEQDEDSVGAYENHTWIISATVPEDISSGKSYVITDTLDNRLDYAGNVRVTLETTDGQTVAAILAEGADYILTVDDVDSLNGEKPGDSLEISLTRTGMSAIAAAVGNDSFENYRLRVYFDAQINANAEMGKEIPNQAEVEYTNSVNFTFEAVSDKPVVYTGAVNLLKVDSKDQSNVLPGAVFEVYRLATPEEIIEQAEYVTTRSDIFAPVVKMSFHDNALLTGERVTSVTSDENGLVAIYGLPYGQYYLVEIQAPEGYNLLSGPVEFTVDASSHIEDNTLVVENISGTVLPETGGIGTGIYTASGLVLVAVSMLLILKKKRQTGYSN